VSPQRSALIGLGAALAAAGVIAAVYGLRDGALTFALLAALGAPALVLAHIARARRRRIGSPRRQLAAGIAIAGSSEVVTRMCSGSPASRVRSCSISAATSAALAPPMRHDCSSTPLCHCPLSSRPRATS
jgi:hypothetical protein